MVVLNDSLNRIKNLVNEDIFKCQAGTGTTAANATDTGLETEVSATLFTRSKVVSDKAIQVTHDINPSIATSSALSEQEIQVNSGSSSFNRIVHTALTKNANDQFTYITNIFFKSV